MKMQTFGKIIRILLLLIILITAVYFLINQTETPEPSIQPIQETTLKPEQPTTQYYHGKVTKITDGDTLEIDNIPIRLALVDSPEYYQEGFQEAKQFTSTICPIGSTATVDVDQGQPTDKYNRTVAVVYCNNTNLNDALLINRYATIDKEFCNISEFKDEEWAKNRC